MGDSYHPSRYRDRYSPPRRDYYDGHRNDHRDEYRDSGYSFRGAAGDRDPRDAPTDSYRPPRGDFTFQAAGPPAPRFPPAPRDQPAPSRPRQDFRKGRGGGRGGRGFGRGGRFIPKPAHKRAILGFTEGENAPEEMFGTYEHAKFREMDSSDEEAEDASDAENGEQSRKRPKTTDEAEQPARPQWSNPDPYSVLPPTDVVTTAKKDIVQTIRKRKAEAATAPNATNSIKENADFISFNFDEESKEESEGEIDSSEGDDDDFIGAPPKHSGAELPPPPPPQGFIMPTNEELMQTYAGNNAGKRKRGFEQTLSSAAGTIVDEWLPDGSDMTLTPWLDPEDEFQSNVGLQLHKEILDFFDYVAPRSYERAARMDLIDRIERVVRRAPGGGDVNIRSFGSFASDLYLPTADMDLVAVSRSYMSGGSPSFCQTNSKMHKLASLLKSWNVARDDMVTVITKAKVPILKFVDAQTGIKVDISFENDSGLNAIPTFREWKERYHQMPVLVVLIKQFLTMRGLNEVFLGGIGGFTIICLVTSMLQHMPEEQLNSPDVSYGELLQNFFDLYGNKFDIRSTGIMMNPAKYFRKGVDRVYCKVNPATLTIVDPNRPENDISGGSRQIDQVFKCFRGAYNEIQKRLNDVRTGKAKSILGCILGGNYSSFRAQRELLRSLDDGGRPQQAHTAPPPPRPQATLPQHQPGYYNYPQYPEPSHGLPNRPPNGLHYAPQYPLPPLPPPLQSDATDTKLNRAAKRAEALLKKQANKKAKKEAEQQALAVEPNGLHEIPKAKKQKTKKARKMKKTQKRAAAALAATGSSTDPLHGATTKKSKKEKQKPKPSPATGTKSTKKKLEPKVVQNDPASRRVLRERKVISRRAKKAGTATEPNGI